MFAGASNAGIAPRLNRTGRCAVSREGERSSEMKAREIYAAARTAQRSTRCRASTGDSRPHAAKPACAKGKRECGAPQNRFNPAPNAVVRRVEFAMLLTERRKIVA